MLTVGLVPALRDVLLPASWWLALASPAVATRPAARRSAR